MARVLRLRSFARRCVTDAQWQRARRSFHRLGRMVANLALAYDGEDLVRALRELGVQPGDMLLVHAAMRPFSGFRGAPRAMVDALLNAVGEDGTLLMMSLPYSGSTAEYLRAGPVFDVLKTPSRMGVLSEVFRRRDGVLRSLHPTHPVLAAGARAEWITAGHEECAFPCGAGSPFEKLLAADGKVLFLDVPFNTFTFIHHLEHLVSGALPFALYDPEPRTATLIGRDRRARTLRVHAFSERAVRARNPRRLERALAARGVLRTTRVGNSRLTLVRCRDAADAARRLAAARPLFIFDEKR